MIYIDGYSDFSQLGKGGFAVVYKARQTSIGRDVAIKVLSDPIPDDDLVRRFRRESRAVGALSWHPNIAAVLDTGQTDDGRAFIAFELLPGGTLELDSPDEPLAWKTAVSYMIQVSDAVGAAHQEGVLHRDIKPANIMLDRLGNAKLVDFGIADMQDGQKTESGVVAATIHYAAPELFDGHSANELTDVYSMAATLYELVDGAPPLACETAKTIAAQLKRVIHESPSPLKDEAAPEALSGLLLAALSKNPEDRPQTAFDFGRALQKIQQSQACRVTAMAVADRESPRVAARKEFAPQNTAANKQAVPIAVPNKPKRSGIVKAALLALVVVALGIAGFFARGLFLNSAIGSSPLEVIAETQGGAKIAIINEFEPTIDVNNPVANAFDHNPNTAWGLITTADAAEGSDAGSNGYQAKGTTLVLRLSERQQINSVGAENSENTSPKGIATLRWATTVADVRDKNFFATTTIDQNGRFSERVNVQTEQLVVYVESLVDDELSNVGLGELLIEAEPIE